MRKNGRRKRSRKRRRECSRSKITIKKVDDRNLGAGVSSLFRFFFSPKCELLWILCNFLPLRSGGNNEHTTEDVCSGSKRKKCRAAMIWKWKVFHHRELWLFMVGKKNVCENFLLVNLTSQYETSSWWSWNFRGWRSSACCKMYGQSQAPTNSITSTSSHHKTYKKEHVWFNNTTPLKL